MASPANFVSNGRLQVLQEPVDASQDGVDIILVPGTGTAPPENWPFASRKWLGTLPGSGAGARILAYKYASPLTGTKPSWESILMLGYDLLQQLSDEQFRSASDPPILMVCHSLGGVIVKQALCVANKQFPRYGPTVNAIAGILFLSTPHRYGDKTTSLTRFRDILEATSGKPFKIPNANVEEEGAVLIDLADRFEGISFRTPILSVYELRETKNNSTPLRSKYQFVSREACLTHAPLETVIGLNLDHHETCLFTKSRGAEGLTELNKFIHNTMLDAKHLVALRLKDQEYQYATTSAYSPTMSELPLRGELKIIVSQIELQELTEQPSNRATEGTSSSEFELVHPVPTYAETQKRLHLPCFLLNTHAANEEFCGREDVLKRLAAELLPSKNAVTASNTSLRQFALCGFGGIGKTEIAREFARRHKDSFDAVFWVVADEVAKLDHHYQQISLALGLENPSECKSQVVSRETVKGWLSNPQKHLSGSDEVVQPGQARSEATWLLVFDNADDPMMLADYWPQGSGSILITSRDPLAKSIFTRTPSGLDLGPLTRQEILYLFHHLTTAFDDPEEDTARQISDAFGGVPLAISQMAGIIRRQDLTLSEFFELYKDHEEHASLYETKFDTNLVTYRHSLSTVWAFEKLKPQARQLLELISFLDPDAIAEDLLMQAWVEVLSNNGPPFKKSQYIEARADLLQSSLVQRDKSRQQISVHRIVQDAIFATMDIAKKRSIFGKIVRVLWAEWPSAMPKPSKEPELPQPKSNGGRLNIGRWPVCAASYPHVLKMHQLWPAIADPSEATRLHFAKLLNEAAWYAYQKERGWTKNFDGFFETARKIGEASAHADRDSLLADIYFCLGSIAMDASDFDTSRIYKERSFDLVSQICKSLGTADERLYLAYAERGISRIQDERYEEGEADLKEALRIRKALGNYVPRSGEANLSWALLAQVWLAEKDPWAKMTESLSGLDSFSMLLATSELRKANGTRALNTTREHGAKFAQQWATKIFTLQLSPIKLLSTLHDNVGAKRQLDPNARKNEIARTTFFKGKVFEATGKAQKASISLKVASRLRKEIVDDDRDVSSLTTRDFDGIVSFWAR
ncbi:tetratricopeptide repeat domain-containing protein [Colletotrichum higginsianum]|uniref:Tetratricopeptide repeat domain-containing protein n=1 Tax=Colletotrichum higginsianum (strain IMI 349063) TaxID=759273 RepID=H1UZ40_COLHI|nr:tetratricopeptide repeat domain-containing protein [Colletotrichum higginsianum]